MSGDSINNDDGDFLDEDFVVEDIVGANEDLEELFDEPAPATAPAAAAKPAPPAADAPPDADDVLFTDHTEGLQASETFDGQSFEEGGDSKWNGELLDLESVGVPETSLEAEEAVSDPELFEAKESFVAELDSMLHSNEDFLNDGEQELEAVGQEDVDDGIHEFEQSGPFVLDDGEGLWSDDAESDSQPAVASSDASDSPTDLAPIAAELADAESVEEVDPSDEATRPRIATYEDTLLPPTDGDEHHDLMENMPLAGRASDDEHEAGWEPLPSTSVDALSEVDEVRRADEEGYEDYEEDAESAEYGAVGLATKDLDDVDGHDLYGEEEGEHRAVVLGGPGQRRGRALSIFLSLAASLLIVLGGAVIVMRPEWFGLRFEPAQVERVALPRPTVEVLVPEPPSLLADAAPTDTGDGTGETGTGETGTGETGTGETGTGETGTGETGTGATGTGETGTGETGAGEPGTGQPTTGETGSGETTGGQTTTTPTPEPPANNGTGDAGAVVTTTPTQVPDTVVQQPDGNPSTGGERPVQSLPIAVVQQPDIGPSSSWPVAVTTGEPVVAEGEQKLARFGDGLMVGELAANKSRAAMAVDGVLPGSRAFAQLHNGNYFIGKVKHVAPETITLRVETGEVTLATDDIAQLTRLGSADYEELQKATRGFVRLTNNNRLVGGILSRIADDHVVLEFRSNRVMLPKSLVGEIVSGEGEDAVRLDTTLEEDSWLRKLAERELGSGKGAEVDATQQPKAPAQGGPPR